MDKTKEEIELEDAIDYLKNCANLNSDAEYCVDVLIKQLTQLRELLAKVDGGEG